ncbi:MAG: endonuclease [Anaerolineae bacterium]|nr:endonuclease [Candidatus Roseilinea sp.]MDW8448818.1 endonuclease [Anaerolineae bacterium]
MVYLLTFPAIGSDKHRASHYIGYCDDDPTERLERHRAGQGARITAAAVERHGPDALVLVWALPGTRDDERRMKRQRNHRRFLNPDRARAFLAQEVQR